MSDSSSMHESLMRASDHLWERLRIAALALAVMGVGGLLSTAPVDAQHAEPVSLYVTVEQGDKLVTGLQQPSFRLLEDGQSREFRLEQPEKPVSIAVAVEYSKSSALYFNDIQMAVQGFMKAAPEGDWLAISTFSKNLNIRVDFTKERGEVEDAFSSLGQPLSSEINTYDAVYEMLDKMGNLKGRRVLILIGSGLDSFSKHTLDEVRRKIQSSNVTVYGVGAGSLLRGRYEHSLSSSQRMHLTQAQAFMNMLANESGGEAWFPKFESAYLGVMKGVLQSIDSQYRLVYTSQVPADQKFHKIKVEAFHIVNDRRQNFRVRARAGWRF